METRIMKTLHKNLIFYLIMQTILVTGGTGLVGQGIRLALERTKGDGKQENENWVFLSSKDCNLLYVMK